MYDQLRAGRASERRAFVLWEPYVSKALKQPGVHVLLDSSKLQGYIVDVLVAERQFLKDHPDKVKAVVEAYLVRSYASSQKDDGLEELGNARMPVAQAWRRWTTHKHGKSSRASNGRTPWRIMRTSVSTDRSVCLTWKT